MKASTHEMIWDLISVLGILAIYFLIALAIYNKAWLEGLFWVSLLLLDKARQIKARL